MVKEIHKIITIIQGRKEGREEGREEVINDSLKERRVRYRRRERLIWETKCKTLLFGWKWWKITVDHTKY